MLHAAFRLLRPHHPDPLVPRKVDMMAVDTTEGRIYSILAVAWGLVADIDIESEKYRFMGGARFTVGAVARVLNLRSYRGRISFLPVDPAEARETLNAKRERALSSPSKRSSIMGTQPNVIVDDGQHHTLNGNDAIDFPNTGRYRSLEDLTNKKVMRSADSNSSLANSSKINTSPSTSAYTGSPLNISGQSGSSSTNGVETPLLPESLNDPVPLNWMTIEDSFVGVVATRCSHLAADFVAHPVIKPDDGAIWLVITRAPIGRRALMNQLFAMGRGDRVDLDPSLGAEIYRVLAFRIEPVPKSAPGRIMTIDGERIPYGPIQAQVLPGVGNLI